jgi:hypothetical protein
MTKLQMATDAIGDIESLLEASGMGGGGEEEDSGSFDDKIRELVIAALAGKDMKAATEKIAHSIDAAKMTLEQEKANIDATLGAMDGYEYVGPQTPTLEPPHRSMEFEPFVWSAFECLGGNVTELAPGVLKIETHGQPEYVRLRENVVERYAKVTLLSPGSSAFLRLVDRVTASGLHEITDNDGDLRNATNELTKAWSRKFGASPINTTVSSVARGFRGHVTARIRATTAHDSYERLIDIPCDPSDHHIEMRADGLSAVPEVLQDPNIAGLNSASIVAAAERDPNVAEFIRFYLERRAQETASAGKDQRKQKKLEDEFTPRVETTLVALKGAVERVLRIKTSYEVDGREYTSNLVINPQLNEIVSTPDAAVCSVTGATLPIDCLDTCAISHKRGLKHRLVRSEISGRQALPTFARRCSVSGKQIFQDEAGISDVTTAIVTSDLLKTCAVCGKKGEPEHFGRCSFTHVDVLKERLAVSEVSNKSYRSDQEQRCVVTGKRGHRSEFMSCHETREPLLATEAERCEQNNKLVRPGILEVCAVTGKRVLPAELEMSALSGKRALRENFVRSSVSNASFLEGEGIRSAYGKYCAPIEAKRCEWSGLLVHPEDIRVCSLFSLPIHFQYLSDGTERLQIAEELLSGERRTEDGIEGWDGIQSYVARAVASGKCRIIAAETSPDGKHIAICAEVKSFLGLKTQHAGMLFSKERKTIVGRVAIAKRDAKSPSGLKIAA